MTQSSTLTTRTRRGPDSGRTTSRSSARRRVVRAVTVLILAATTAAVGQARQCTGSITTYCTSGTSVAGCTPSIAGVGVPVVGAPSGFEIVVDQTPGQRLGLIFYAFAPDAVPWSPTSSSLLCVASPLQRTVVVSSGGSPGLCDGELRLDLSTWMQLNQNALGMPFIGGEALYAQGWYRDPGASRQTNLSDALSFSLCPNTSMFVSSCNLGCSSGQSGAQVACGVAQTFINQEIRVSFSAAIDASSLNSASFEIVNVQTGAPASGSLMVDPLDPLRAIFQPSLSFSGAGTPLFGFESNATYQVRLPGVAQGDFGPFIVSTSGHANYSRVQCVFSSDQGVADPVPGAPRMSALVQVLGSSSPVDVTMNAVVGALTNSPLVFVFDDLMNMSTVLIPATGLPPFLKVEVDDDGELLTTADRTPLAGTFTFSFDTTNNTTTVVFVSASGFPSAGGNPLPRRIVIDAPSAIHDLVGNSLANAGQYSFVPQ